MPCTEPLCGWQWIKEHRHDFDGWQATIEIIEPGFRVKVTIRDDRALKEVCKTIISRKEERL